jgi:hypothetical protein
VGPRANLDGRKISPHRDSIPGPPSPYSVAIPTELPGPHESGLVPIIVQENILLSNPSFLGCRAMLRIQGTCGLFAG